MRVAAEDLAQLVRRRFNTSSPAYDKIAEVLRCPKP